MTPPEEPSWPAVGTCVTVHSATPGHWLGAAGGASTVVAHRGDALAVAAPRAPSGGWPPAPGSDLEIRWPEARGLRVLRVQVLDRGSERGPSWWCLPLGEPVREQRRHYVRAASQWPVRAVLSWELPEPGSAQGFLADLSEGGLRARVLGWRGGPGTPVAVRMTVVEADGDAPGAGVVVAEHELFGTVLAVRGDPGAAAASDLQVQFHQPVARADELRAMVFAWQRAERRAARTLLG